MLSSVLSRHFRNEFDVALITDIRLPGGSGSSTAQEISIQHEARLRTALFHAPTATKMRRLPVYYPLKARLHKPGPKIRECLEAGRAEFMPTNSKVTAPLTIIRHPTVATNAQFLPKNLKTDQIIVVINHPAIRLDGLIDYELSTVVKNVERVFGIKPKLCPISPVIAKSCRGRESLDVELDGLWWNILDMSPNLARARSPGERIVIGRHSRDSREKWPVDAAVIRQAYPLADGIDIQVLGGADTAKDILGELPENWKVLPFDSFGSKAFLQSIDVYVYFHHPQWIEAFGRAPGEAMISGIPTILPRAFEPTFGEAAIYCEPCEVLAVVRRLQADPRWYAEVSQRGRQLAAKRFAPDRHLERLSQIAGIEPRI